MNMVVCIALRSFTGPEGIIKKRQLVLLEETTALSLEQSKIVNITRIPKEVFESSVKRALCPVCSRYRMEGPMEFKNGEC